MLGSARVPRLCAAVLTRLKGRSRSFGQRTPLAFAIGLTL